MGLVINTNIASIIAGNNVGKTQTALTKTISHLSSGLRIATAADDAAGLAIAQKLEADNRGYLQAARNANDGVSAMQVAEGGLSEVSDILTRMKELSVQAANGTTSATGGAALQAEFAQLSAEITRVSTGTKFNGIALLGGAFNKTLQVGVAAADTLAADLSTVNITTLTSLALDISTTAGASAAMTAIDADIDTTSGFRGTVGSYQNRLEYTVKNLNVMAQNSAASESQIKDADFATEMASFTKYQVLQQAGVSILAQANSITQSVVKLVG